jgi:hypothetical protein
MSMAMRILSDIPWLKSVFPEGFQSNESTLISGPGGSGKPLVELGFVDAWLKAGGSLIGIPLQYPSHEMVRESLMEIYGTSLPDNPSRVQMIRFDPERDDTVSHDGTVWTANLILDGVFEKVLRKAEHALIPAGPGTLVFGSALNLLLFNDTYRQKMEDVIKGMIASPRHLTMIFTVSNNVLSDHVKVWEDAADNLMMTTLDKEKTLRLEVIRTSSVAFEEGETVIPIDKDVLETIAKTAAATRTKNIQAIKSVR